MSFLSDLEREARNARAAQAAQPERAPDKDDESAKLLVPRMRAMHRYLRELAEQLNILEPEVIVSYDIAGFGRLEDLRQGEYQVIADDVENLSRVSFIYVCRGEGTRRLQQRSREVAQRQKEYLWQNNLRFQAKLLASGGSQFMLEPVVPVSWEFEADLERPAIRLRVRNRDVLGAIHYTYAPERVDPQLLDEMGRSVVRRPNRFEAMSGNEVPESTRERLRKAIAARQNERTTPLPEDDADPRPARRKGLLHGLFGR